MLPFTEISTLILTAEAATTAMVNDNKSKDQVIIYTQMS